VKNSLSITVVGLSLTVLFAVTYVLAVAFCIFFAWLSPSYGMMTTTDGVSNMMQAALPGFGWHVAGFFIGLVLTAVYGFYVAIVFVPAYNYFQRHFAATPSTTRRIAEPLPAAG
jgi:hypothetical protein